MGTVLDPTGKYPRGLINTVKPLELYITLMVLIYFYFIVIC